MAKAGLVDWKGCSWRAASWYESYVWGRFRDEGRPSSVLPLCSETKTGLGGVGDGDCLTLLLLEIHGFL